MRSCILCRPPLKASLKESRYRSPKSPIIATTASQARAASANSPRFFSNATGQASGQRRGFSRPWCAGAAAGSRRRERICFPAPKQRRAVISVICHREGAVGSRARRGHEVGKPVCPAQWPLSAAHTSVPTPVSGRRRPAPPQFATTGALTLLLAISNPPPRAPSAKAALLLHAPRWRSAVRAAPNVLLQRLGYTGTDPLGMNPKLRWAPWADSIG